MKWKDIEKELDDTMLNEDSSAFNVLTVKWFENFFKSKLREAMESVVVGQIKEKDHFDNLENTIMLRVAKQYKQNIEDFFKEE